ncbi:shikimate dehydrogenase family protein [Vaginella massiliensis]|uniref:shikimate dehydrogenase family protein n=1 Tax=Vaginella massiliensis TaxID=1816680 RepID=UPI003751BA65
MIQLGLIGRNIAYSFSEKYFQEKFKILNLENYDYRLFDLQKIEEVTTLFNNKSLLGLNVTIPYKTEILTYLDELSDEAQVIGAVNTIHIKNSKKIGYNTDAYGFKESLTPLLKPHHQKALILGNGGAAKAVKYVLNTLGIDYRLVTRQEDENLNFGDIDAAIIESYTLIVNCTPLGTFPQITDAPNIPYRLLNSNHLLYDLIYNPIETQFLKNGTSKGAQTKNGLEMLHLQAEKAWEIWNS